MKETYQDVVDKAGADMAREIDRCMLEMLQMSALLKEGWVMPTFKYSKSNADLNMWVHINAKGAYKNVNGYWIFQDPADATLFTLRWAQ